MYIKQVIIQGFKSYREATVVKFEPGLNVIVGLNGSGKSCLFYAVQFVLGHEFQHMPREQRESLLHSSAIGKVSEAFVEIVLSNEDYRLRDEGETTVRRTITRNQDRFFINQRVATKAEINNVLQSAGFSKINPYYIIKQGRVNELAVASNAYRLNLLREVGGHVVWAERRSQAIHCLETGSSSLEKVKEFLSSMGQNMEDMEKEFQDYCEWRNLDKRKRAIEFFLVSRDLKRTKDKLKQKYEELKSLETSTDEVTTENEQLFAEEETLEKQKDNLEAQYELQAGNYGTSLARMQEILSKKNQLEFTIAECERNTKTGSFNEGIIREELRQVDEQIAAEKSKLSKFIAKFEFHRKQESELNASLLLREQRLMELYAKQGRKSKFRTREERDQWIDRELQSLEQTMDEERSLIQALKQDLETSSSSRVNLQQNISALEQEVAELKSVYRVEYTARKKLQQDLDNLKNQQRDLWSRENKVLERQEKNRQAICEETTKLAKLAGKGIVDCMESIEKVLESMKNDGGEAADMAENYYGVVADLFECSSACNTAIDVVLGKRALYHVVKNDEVASEILRRMNAMRLKGEANFFPLNRMQLKEYEYPEDRNCSPLLEHVSYEDDFELVMQFVFGRVLLCPTIDAATQFARKFNLNCVTFQGDMVYSKGTMTGGFIANSTRKLDSYLRLKELKYSAATAESELEGIRQNLEGLGAEIKQKFSEIQRMECHGLRTKLEEKIKFLEEQKSNLLELDNRIPAQQKLLEQYQTSLRLWSKKYESMELEKEQELSSQLLVLEREEVKQLQVEIKSFRTDLETSIDKRLKWESRKLALENLLNNNLLERRRFLERDLNSALPSSQDETPGGSQKEKLQCEEAELNRKLRETEAEVEKSEFLMNQTKNQLEQLKKELEDVIGRRKEIQNILAEKQLKVSSLNEQIFSLNTQLAKLGNMIHQCGTTNSEWEKYERLNSKSLCQELQKVNEELKKFANINLQVEMQRERYKKIYDTAADKLKQLDEGATECWDLVGTVDVQKNEALHNTFVSVARYFHQIFKSLVPQGAAYLRWTYDSENRPDGDEEDLEDIQSPDMDSITGVAIMVTFNRDQQQFSPISSLSGGQRTLISLAFVLAIQMLDRAPFYLLDEADMALDCDHRKTVAELISRLSGRSQFIVTTFRPEFLPHANKVFGVVNHNHSSRISEVSFEQADDFIRDEADEEVSLTSSSIL